MAVTMKQISEAAGVSRGTVDRVLNNRGRVREETRSHILAIAREMGYTPNLAGKALASRKKAYVIGILLSAQGNPFFDEVVRGIRAAEKQLDEYGVRVELNILKGYSPVRQKMAVEELRKTSNVVILNPIAVDTVANTINETVQMGIPVITLNTDIENTRRMCYVGSDYTASGKTACGMLALSLSGGEVLVFSGSEEILGHRQRVSGFLQEITRCYQHLSVVDVAYIQDDNDLAYKTALALLEKYPNVTGIYIATAGTAGIAQAVVEKGRMGKICIICSDVVPTTRSLIEQGIISAAICQQSFQQGYHAVRHAFDYLLTDRPQNDWIAENQITILQNLL